MPDVTVLAVGTGTGDGSPTPQNQLVVTSEGQHNVILKFISPTLAITVRFIDTFLTVLLGVLTAAGLANTLIPFTDFKDLVMKGATVAATSAAYGLLKDLATLFTNLKQKFPLLGA